MTPAGKQLRCCEQCRSAGRAINQRRRQQIGAAGVRADHLRDKYAMTAEEYDALRVRHGYRCAICGRHEDELPQSRAGRPRRDGLPTASAPKLVVDHCHESGRVRGLLCIACNAALGHFGDREESVLAAVDYLRRAAAAPPPPGPLTTRLRLIDLAPGGRPARTVLFRGATVVQVDGYRIELRAGETKTVVSSSGEYTTVDQRRA